MFRKNNKAHNSNLEALALTAFVTKIEQREIEKLFTRLFSTEDGKKALAYLQTITFHRALNINSTDAQLRYTEGQRALVATIMRLIDRGKQSSI